MNPKCASDFHAASELKALHHTPTFKRPTSQITPLPINMGHLVNAAVQQTHLLQAHRLDRKVRHCTSSAVVTLHSFHPEFHHYIPSPSFTITFFPHSVSSLHSFTLFHHYILSTLSFIITFHSPFFIITFLHPVSSIHSFHPKFHHYIPSTLTFINTFLPPSVSSLHSFTRFINTFFIPYVPSLHSF